MDSVGLVSCSYTNSRVELVWPQTPPYWDRVWHNCTQQLVSTSQIERPNQITVFHGLPTHLPETAMNRHPVSYFLLQQASHEILCPEMLDTDSQDTTTVNQVH